MTSCGFDIVVHAASFSPQVDPEKYGGIVNGFRVTLKESGVRELGRGWAPTFFGYSAQGLCKFGFYEVFKALYSNLLGEVIYFPENLFFCFLAELFFLDWHTSQEFVGGEWSPACVTNRTS